MTNFLKMKFGIVVQGPVIEVRTRDIINHYILNNTGVKIILSTWTNSPRIDIIHEDLTVIRTEPPIVPGCKNRHLQRVSSHAGVDTALSLGCTHVLKCRTDQLLRRPNLCDHLYSVLKTYGTDRFVVGSNGTTLEPKWGKFHVSDFWVFSTTQNLLAWYGVPRFSQTGPYFNPLRTDYISPEPDLAQSWMERVNCKDKTTEEFFGKRIVVLDGIDVLMIFKFVSLQANEKTIAKALETKHTDPLRVTHGMWLKLFDKFSNKE